MILYVKGASEIVLEGCSKLQGFDGQIQEMTAQLQSQIQSAIEVMANQALRTIIIAHKEVKPESKFYNSLDFSEKDERGVF